MRTFNAALLCGLTIAMAAGASAAPRPPASKSVSEAKPLPKIDPPIVKCQGDPAISRIILTKGKSPGSVRVTVETRNAGAGAWRSGANQQSLALSVRNGNTGAVSRHGWPLPGDAAAGASMGSHSTPLIADAFDTFEFRGTVEAMIVYDPDIRIDGNACNDDANAANNVRRVSDDAIGRFLASSASTMQF